MGHRGKEVMGLNVLLYLWGGRVISQPSTACPLELGVEFYTVPPPAAKGLTVSRMREGHCILLNIVGDVGKVRDHIDADHGQIQGILPPSVYTYLKWDECKQKPSSHACGFCIYIFFCC